MERAGTGVVRARRHRWVGTGRSTHADAAVAGGEAAHAALQGRDDAGLLLLMASGPYDLVALAGAAQAAAGRVPVVGCTTAGEHPGAPVDPCVVALALGGAGFSFSTAVVDGGEARDAGASVAACLGDVADHEHRVLLLLLHGHVADETGVVRGAYSVAGAGVPLVGAVAAPRPDGAPGAVLHGRSVLREAVVGVAIGSDAPIGVGARHGRRVVGEPMLVTRAMGGRVLELDGRPAEDVYLERLEAVGAATPQPVGIQRRVGEASARHVELDRLGDGGIACPVPAGALVWILDGDRDDALAAVDAACLEALDGLHGEAPAGVLVLDCDERAGVLGGEGAREAAAIVDRHAGGAPVVRAASHGEIARTRGILGFHEHTVVVLALA